MHFKRQHNTNKRLTQPNQLQEQISKALNEMVEFYVFLRMEMGCEGTSQLSSYDYALWDILEETSSDSHDTRQHLPLHNICLQHQQTFGLPSYKHQTVTENFVWLQGGLLVEDQDNETEATRCCYNSHCNTDERSPHQERLVCISAIRNLVSMEP